MGFRKKALFCFFLVFSLAVFQSGIAEAGKTVMISGIWVANRTPELVQAEINGNSETVCLPKLEFSVPVDGKALQAKIRSSIQRQGAVFHLLSDGLGSPMRKSGMLYATDVFLKDLKMPWSTALQEWGYKFKISSKPAYEDPGYISQVQTGAYVYTTSEKPEKDNDKKPTGDGSGKGESGGNPSVSGGAVRTSYDVLPAGVIPPSMRKMKDELDKKIREIKNRPFKAEVLKVDVVRWASGKMGEMVENGRIKNAQVEGRKIDCLVQRPMNKSWLTQEVQKALASQSCEFILQRDTQGRELMKEGAYVLADLYFSDLGLSWDEFLKEHKMNPTSFPIEKNYATEPVTLSIVGVDGVWKGLKAPVLGTVKLSASTAGPGGEETIRLPSPGSAIKDFKAFCAKLDGKTVGKPVHVSLITCPDGKPYLELGQKRASRVLFSEKKTTLQILMKELLEEKK